MLCVHPFTNLVSHHVWLCWRHRWLLIETRERGFWKRSVISLLAMESRNSQEPDISFWFFPVLGFFGPRWLSWPTFIGYQLTKTLNTQTTARSFLPMRYLTWQFDRHRLALVTIWFPMSMFLFLPGAKKSHCRCKGDLKSSPLWLPQGFLPTEKSSPRLKTNCRRYDWPSI